jgi:radical SAM protein with 4Fe4S-binding SPASM domain
MDSVIKNYKALFLKWLGEYDKGKTPFDLQIGFAFQGGYLTQKRIDLYSDKCTCCWYKRKSMTVKWDGRVTPCSMDHTAIGHVDNLAAAWDKMQTLSYRRIRVQEIEGCKDCRLLHLCNGGCRACVGKDMETIGKDIISCHTYKFLDEILPLLRERGVKDAIRNEDYQEGHLPNLPAPS